MLAKNCEDAAKMMLSAQNDFFLRSLALSIDLQRKDLRRKTLKNLLMIRDDATYFRVT